MENTTPTSKPATPAPKRKRGWFKSILIVLLIAFVVMQFFQPDKNNQSTDYTKDIATVVTVPDEVHNILKTSCYDCHSNNTEYPWYTNIQPVGWWLKDHIEEGQGHLNLQDFANLQPNAGSRFKTQAALQDHKLEEITEMVEKDEMPLYSYTIVHGDAKLSEAQKKTLLSWVDSARAELKRNTALASNTNFK